MRYWIDKVLSNVLVFLMAVMVASVSWQVISRYILNDPSSITEELARYLLVWIGILGAAYASGQKAHIAITLFPDKLSPDRRKILDVVLYCIIILFAITALVIGGSRLVYITYKLGQESASLNLPLFIVYSVVPLSGLLIIAYKLLDIFNQKSTSHE